MRSGSSVATLVMVALSAACNGDSESTDDGNGDTEDLKRRFCEASIAREERCGREPDTLDRCMHHEDSRCLFDLVRPEILDDTLACVDDLPCSGSATVCFYYAGDASPAAGQQEYIAACDAKHDACQPNSNLSNFCELPFATAATYERMSACLELECDEVPTCVMNARPASCSS